LDSSPGYPEPGVDAKSVLSFIKNFSSSVLSTINRTSPPPGTEYGNIGTVANSRISYPIVGTTYKQIQVQNQSIIIEGLSYTIARFPEYGSVLGIPKIARISLSFYSSYDSVHKSKSWNAYDQYGNPTGTVLPSIINIPNIFAELYGRPYQEHDIWYGLEIYIDIENGGYPSESIPTWWTSCTLNCASIRLISN
jgi:hypothetical protein